MSTVGTNLRIAKQYKICQYSAEGSRVNKKINGFNKTSIERCLHCIYALYKCTCWWYASIPQQQAVTLQGSHLENTYQHSFPQNNKV